MLLRILTFFKWVYGNPLTFLVGIRRIPAYHVDYTTDTAVCVTKRESSETEALVECDEREEVIHNIHIDRHKYPPSAASAPGSLTH